MPNKITLFDGKQNMPLKFYAITMTSIDEVKNNNTVRLGKSTVYNSKQRIFIQSYKLISKLLK